MTALDLSLGRMGRQALIYGFGFVLSRAASFVMLPIYTRYLTPADYGVLQLLQMTLDVAAILLVAGIRNGVLRFYFKAESAQARLSVISTSLLVLQGFNLLAALALLAVARPVAELFLTGSGDALLVRIAAGSLLLEAGTVVPLLFMQAEQRATLHTVVSAVRLVLQVGLNVALVVFAGWGVAGVVTSTLVTNAVMATGLVAWTLRRTGLRLAGGTLRDLVRFGLPYRVTEAGTFLLTFADRWFLRVFTDLAAIGIYSLAYQFGFLLAYLGPVPLLQAWNPQRFELASHPREVRDPLYDRGFLFFDLVVVTLAVGIALFVHPVLVVMADPAFHAAADLAPILLAAFVLQSWKDVVEIGIQISERTQFATYATWISVGVVLALDAWWIPVFGPLGAACATLVGFAVRFLCFHLWSRRLFPIRYHWAPHLWLLLWGSAAVLAARLLRPEGLAAESGAALGWFALYLVLAGFGGVLSASDRGALAQLARQSWSALRSR